MTTHIVRLVKNGQTLIELGTLTPFVDPTHTYEHTNDEPPRLLAVDKHWTVEGRIVGAGAAETVDAWHRLTRALEDGDNYPDGVELVRDGTVIERISKGAGYEGFKILNLASARDPIWHWRGAMPWKIEIVGRKRVGPDVQTVELTEVFNYDDRGLLTRTLTGIVETHAGKSAVEAARAFGLRAPGPDFGLLTPGPGGVNAERLNEADTRARFTSILQQAGTAIPAGVSPIYALSVSTVKADGKTTTTTSVTARGPDARAAVERERPAGELLLDQITTDAPNRTATAVYVQRRNVDQRRRLLRTHSFSSRGGGRPIRYTRRTGGRKPARHVLAYSEVELVEDIRIEVTGVPQLGDFTVPDPLNLPEDTDARQFSPWPTRVTIAAERDGDVWVMGLRRIYRVEELEIGPSGFGRAVFDVESSGSDPEAELRRGRPPSAGSITLGFTRV